MRYLVVDKNMSLSEEKGLTMETTIQTLEAALRRLPSDPNGTIPLRAETTATDFIPTQVTPEEMSPTGSPVQVSISPQETSPASMSASLNGTASCHGAGTRDDAVSLGSVEDAVSSTLDGIKCAEFK